MEASPPVITPETRRRAFRNEIFQNITDIAARHRTSLVALFARQREQHPLISSIADIELDTALSLQNHYEAYIKVTLDYVSKIVF
jgi:RHO1 GDP-GTP exchange protein 1/2